MASEAVRLDDGSVDLERGVVNRLDQTRRLTRMEVRLLGYLAERAGQEISREELHREVWGYHPNVVTRAADNTVRRLRTKIEVDPTSPQHLLTVQGIGYRFVAGRPSALNDAPPPADDRLPPPPTNLPNDPGVFVGRESELEALGRGLAEGARLTTLVGPGGVGKTRLALRFAATLHDERTWPGGVWFSDAARATSDVDFVDAVASPLGVTSTGAPAEAAQRVGRALEARGAVFVVVDNVEQVRDVAARRIAEWMEAAPEARFLVTSREPLQIQGETRRELATMSAPDAIDLFERRARAVRPNADLAREAVASVVERLDRLPLAVELAAARVAVMSVPEIEKRLSARLEVLTSSGAAGRHASLRDAIQWSWDLLGDWERTAFAHCAVFRGGFDLAAAEAVLDLSSHADAPSVLDVVQALAERSLLSVRETSRGMRFWMLVSIGEYGVERLRERADASEVEARHADHFLSLFGDETWDLSRIAEEAPNLLAAHARFAGAERAIAAALVLDPLYRAAGPTQTHRSVLDAGAAVGEEGGATALRQRVLIRRAELRISSGDLDGAEADLATAEGIEGGAIPRLRISQGNVARRRGHIEEARTRFVEALDGARASAHTRAEALALRHLGVLMIDDGEMAQARESIGRAIALHQREGRRRELAAARMDLAAPLLEIGDDPEARRQLDAAIAELVALGDARREALARGNLAVLHHQAGRLAEARTEMEVTLRRAREAGSRRFEAFALGALGFLEHEEGALPDALSHQRNALSLFRQLGDHLFEALTLARLAAVAAEQGDEEGARTDFARARAQLGEGATFWLEGVSTLESLLAERPAEAEAALSAVPASAFARIARRIIVAAEQRRADPG